MHIKDNFQSHVLLYKNYHVEMLTKLINKNIYGGCLVPVFSSSEAEQNGERILKIGWKLRKLWLFKACHYIENSYSQTWEQHLNGKPPAIYILIHVYTVRCLTTPYQFLYLGPV